MQERNENARNENYERFLCLRNWCLYSNGIYGFVEKTARLVGKKAMVIPLKKAMGIKVILSLVCHKRQQKGLD